MSRWRRTVDINRHLDKDELTLVQQAAAIHSEFAASGLYKTYAGGDLLEYVEELKEQAQRGDPDYFDIPLMRIYDWCDEQRIWCGG